MNPFSDASFFTQELLRQTLSRRCPPIVEKSYRLLSDSPRIETSHCPYEIIEAAIEVTMESDAIQASGLTEPPAI